MANSKENYLRMLILFLPYLDCRFFHKNTFSQEELENEILMGIEHHGHIHNLDMVKSTIQFYYSKNDTYHLDDFYEMLKNAAQSLLTYHHNRLCIDMFDDNMVDEAKKYISFYHNKTLDYLELNKLIADSLLAAFYNCYNDYDLEFCLDHNMIQTVSVVNHQLNTILLKGIAETHTHIVGSIPFEKQWNWLGHEILDHHENVRLILKAIDDDKSVKFQKQRYGYNGSLTNLIIATMMLRLLLMLYLVYYFYNKDVDLESYLCKFEEKLNGKIKVNYVKLINYYMTGLAIDDFNYNDFDGLIVAIEKVIYGLSNYQKDGSFSKKVYQDFVRRFIENKDLDVNKYIEYILQHQSIAYIKEKNDQRFKEFFLHYIKVKNFIHSFIVQSSDIKGFLEFQYFFRRQHMIFDIQPNMFKNIFDTYLYDQVKFLEIRIGHVKFKYSSKLENYENLYASKINVNETVKIYYKTVLDFVTSYLTFLKTLPSNRLVPQVGLILHFNKRYDDIEKCWDNYFKVKDDSLIRYKQYQEECFLNLIIFQKIRAEIPYADEYLVGIDGASNELLSEPWVLAPIFRSVKDKYKSILKDKAFNRYGIKLLATKDLGITYHVGEVFHSIASGLRHVDEVIDYYGYQNGERIGHGTILGISIDNYVDNHRIISLPAIELLDNLLWLYHLKAYKNLFKDISISYLEEQIWKITHFIYDINGHLGGNSEGINIHHLYLAYKKQFAGLDFVKDEYYLLNCQANFSSRNCIFKNSKNWNEDLLFYSRHCRCFLKKMTRMIQIDTSDETIINIYKEAQQYVINKIAYKGIIIETNPVSNANIGEFNSMNDHPIFMMNDSFDKDHNHVMVSVNTDDPGVFGTTLKNQYGFILQVLIDKGVPMEKALKWIDMTRENGLNSTFINRTKKTKKEIEEELNKIKRILEEKLNRREDNK